MSSQPPAAFAQLFGQLGQAMQNSAATAPVSQDGASQPFEGAFTQLFGQLGQAMQSSVANTPVGQDGPNQTFRFNIQREFQFGASSPAPENTNQQGEETSIGQDSRDWSDPETRSGTEPSAPDFSNVLRGMATGVTHAFQTSSGFGEAMSNVASDFSAGFEQAVQNMTASPEFQNIQETMTNMAEMFGDQQPSRPSTSEATLQSLPKVQVTDYDLQQEQNSGCSVCLEQYALGDTAVRLPCGHLYHEDCCKTWLKSANTCPVCRFELPTDDDAYEQARGARRPRLRLADLSAKSVSELRHFAQFLGIDYTGCIEKSDLVNRIAASGAVEMIPEPSERQHAEERHGEERHATYSEAGAAPAMNSGLSLGHLEKMTVRDIKAEMTRLGVDQKGCLEKADLIERLVVSGNVDARQVTTER